MKDGDGDGVSDVLTRARVLASREGSLTLALADQRGAVCQTGGLVRGAHRRPSSAVDTSMRELKACNLACV